MFPSAGASICFGSVTYSINRTLGASAVDAGILFFFFLMWKRSWKDRWTHGLGLGVFKNVLGRYTSPPPPTAPAASTQPHRLAFASLAGSCRLQVKQSKNKLSAHFLPAALTWG